MIALCDCNNFFVSCERVYRPELRGRPVVVLSSNDGCIISRSNEAKSMGIKMGTPYFQVREYISQKGVAVCSGNLVAYKKISDKVMAVLARYAGEIEAYSIDEAFFTLPAVSAENYEGYASEIRETVDRALGIPASIGIARTKTLAKLACEFAKKTERGVFQITEANLPETLQAAKIEDVWGIGNKAAAKLNGHGIFDAAGFVRMNPAAVKRYLTVRGILTQLELRGQPCIPLITSPAPPKSIQVSRTWGSRLDSEEDVNNAILDNVIKAGRLLRGHKLAAGAMGVYLRYGYRHHGECGYMADDVFFDFPVMSDMELIAASRLALNKIYKPGFSYTQGGVILCRLSESIYRQRDLFSDFKARMKYERFSLAVDAINEHFGDRVIYPASLAVKDKKWRPQRKFLSEEWRNFN